MPLTVTNEAGEYVGAATNLDKGLVVMFSNLPAGHRLEMEPSSAAMLAVKLLHSALAAHQGERAPVSYDPDLAEAMKVLVDGAYHMLPMYYGETISAVDNLNGFTLEGVDRG
jgi:hypothetical protein